MPQNTPMKRQFTTIDGRTVMSNLPQHWGGNDWTITGVDNPLPVGNYVQTESGVWIPQKGSDDGAADVRLTGSIVEEIIPRQLFTEGIEIISFEAPENARGAYVAIWVRGVTGVFNTNEGLNIWTRLGAGSGVPNVVKLETNNIKATGRHIHAWGVSNFGDAISDTGEMKSTTIVPQKTISLRLEVKGNFQAGEGFDLQGNILWF